MKRHKIKIICNWANDDDILKRLLSQFKTSDKQIENIEFVKDDSYESIVVFGYINQQIKKNVNVLIFPQEPTWSGGHQKTFDGIERVFGFDTINYHQKNLIEETIAHMFYGSSGPIQEGWNFWTYENLYKTIFPKQKNICSFVSNRGINHVDIHQNSLYDKRINLIQSIHKKVSFVDFFGWGGNGDNLLSFVNSKGNVLKNYKFCLAIENSHENYYVSEKFYDCVLTNTIPIYFGCKNILNYWDTNGFILLDNIVDFDYVTEKLLWIESNADKLYDEMLPNLLKMKDRYFSEFNLINKIKKELKIL